MSHIKVKDLVAKMEAAKAEARAKEKVYAGLVHSEERQMEEGIVESAAPDAVPTGQ